MVVKRLAVLLFIEADTDAVHVIAIETQPVVLYKQALFDRVMPYQMGRWCGFLYDDLLRVIEECRFWRISATPQPPCQRQKLGYFGW
jgi:hypothetical protein